MNVRKEIIRFLSAGAIATAIDFSVYYFLFHFLSFGISKGISFACAGFAGYVLNKYGAFKHNRPSRAEFGRYTLVNFLSLGINVLINQSILNAFPGEVFAALVIATTVTGVCAFVCFKWWVFRALLKEGGDFVWWEWFPLRFIIQAVARRQGFLDPLKIISQLQNFAQPSEVMIPTELLRSGVVLHARGLMNSFAIQHNLDWIWPYWVECQYNPRNEAFIPRSFSLTQINLTHRNWTALGVPDSNECSIVDPRGLVTPCYDGWSLDAWIISAEGGPLIPSRLAAVSQKLVMDGGLCIITKSHFDKLRLQTKAQVIGSAQSSVCEIRVEGIAHQAAWLVISLRPYNPEGVSFIHDIALLENRMGWQVNRKDLVYFNIPPERCELSYYHQGDVYSRLFLQEDKKEIFCRVGLASAAAVYNLEAGQAREVAVSVPLTKNKIENESYSDGRNTSRCAWEESLAEECALQIPDDTFKFLYEAAVRTMVLHSPGEVYPGPYIYRRFWFRDAAFILHGLLCAGFKRRVARALECFRSRQTMQGYFLSQEGEWDSNGEALWIIRQYCEMTGNTPPNEWKESIRKAGRWICKKRLSADLKFEHAGLLPAGFSAEHLGPTDFYYWDDFWAVAGLKAAAFLCSAYKDNEEAVYFEKESRELLESIDQSLKKVNVRLKRPAIPASPYRRLDTGAIGSLAAGYPLRLFDHNDGRILDTVDFLMEKCLVKGGFFHDMTHSGINPYLTLHLAQVLLRAGDPRYFDLMSAVANLATSTGQWPEAIHPRTGGGCMGDGQHVWAAAEWVLMVRNCFVREEANRLVLCSGIPRIWLEKDQTISFGPAPTLFGDIRITIKPGHESICIEWSGQWFAQEPHIEVCVPDFPKTPVQSQSHRVTLKRERASCGS
jgi:putative flippase GtrA